jgi:hypothetical protein
MGESRIPGSSLDAASVDPSIVTFLHFEEPGRYA